MEERNRLETERNLVDADDGNNKIRQSEIQAGLDLGFEKTLAHTMPKMDSDIF